MEQAAEAVDATSFVTASEASYQAFKTATLLKTLTVNALIMGEIGVGKKSLAKFILPDASVLDASHYDELLVALESCNEIIITDIDNAPNIKLLIDTLKENSIRVIATSKQSFANQYIDDLFGMKFDIPPLEERDEDIELLINHFVNEAALLFGGEVQLERENFKADLSQNAKSLKRQVMMHYLLEDIKEYELMEIIENYLYLKLGSNSDYRNFLYLYEAPLIKAGMKKFKSQLKLSDKLGLNRNTLRKKISDNQEYLGE